MLHMKHSCPLTPYAQATGPAKAVLLFVHGHGAYLMHELLYVEVRRLVLPSPAGD